MPKTPTATDLQVALLRARPVAAIQDARRFKKEYVALDALSRSVVDDLRADDEGAGDDD